MNVTATGGTANSFLTLYPAGGAVPTASNVNFAAGETIPNLVTVKVGLSGKVAVANAAGAVDVVADVVGYFDSSTRDKYNAIAPTRALDSRTANGGWNAKLTAGAPKSLLVRGIAGIPGTADAVVMNVTVTGATANSFVTAFPAGGQVPTASNLNFASGQTISNLVTVGISSGGQVSFANASGAVHVIADVVGYYDPSMGDLFHALPPARILDSRGPVGAWNAKVAAGSPRHLQVTGAGGVPADATAAIGNATVTGGSANSYLTVYPAGGAVPNASNVNFGVGQTLPNLVAVKMGTGGRVSFANAAGSTDVIFDVVGYFTAAPYVAGSGIVAGSYLSAGQYLRSPNAQYDLIMQGDGNLVIYASGTALWSTNTAGNPGAFAVLQTDGNLVVYSVNRVALWNSGTPGAQNAGYQLALQSDGNLVLYNPAHAALWATYTHQVILNANQNLLPSQYLTSPNGQYTLIVQGDGNVVLYAGGTAVWSTNTAGQSGAYLRLQGDGNLVVYSLGNVALWNSGTPGATSTGYNLRIQDDRNVVLYSPTFAALWSTGTALSTGHPNLGPAPWWNGSCDDGHYFPNAGRHSYPLGASFLGVEVCGPRPINDGAPDVTWTHGGWGEYEWECTELAFRFMYQAYGITNAWPANGNTVYANYSGSYGGGLVKVPNGTVGSAPRPGDVMSFGPSRQFGHVAVVESSSVDGAGNGSIRLISQNDSANGWLSLTVSNWSVQAAGYGGAIGWLHKPGW